MILEVEDITGSEKSFGHVPMPDGATLGDVFGGDERLKTLAVHRVYYNGMAADNWRTLKPGKGDRVKMQVVPQGFFAAFAIISAVLSVVRFVMSLFNRPKVPKARAEHDTSPTYSFDGIRDSFSPGGPVPVVYGSHRLGGQVLTMFTDRPSAEGSNRLAMLLGLCEGVITSVNCVTINGTNLSAFPDAQIDYRLGTQTQTAIPGFEEIRNTFADGRELANGGNGGTVGYDPGLPIIYSTQGNNIRRVTVNVCARNGLYMQWGGKTPRPGPQAVVYRIDKRVQGGGGGWELIEERRWFAQNKAAVWDSFDHDMGSSSAWDFRFQWQAREATERPGQGDFTTDALFLDNLTEIPGDEGQSFSTAYSGTALLSLRAVATAQLHGGRPNVTAVVRGRTVRAYSDLTTYVETWTANPAWCVLDYMTNSIYGMGAFVVTDDMDIQSFIDFATLCDSQVPDGAGGLEAQHRLDLVMDAKKPHWTWVEDILGIYRSEMIYSNGKWKVITDRADLPLRAVFHSGNLIPEKTEVSISGDALRPNQATIRFANKAINDEQDYLYVTASGTAAGTPIRNFDMSLVGVTRQSEALREAGWQLARRNQTRREMKWVTGLDGIAVERGDMARVGIVTTNYEMGYGGRALSGSSLASLVCDREFEVRSGFLYDLFVWHTAANTPETRTLANTISGGGATGVFAVASPTAAFTFPVEVADRWAIGVTSEDLPLVRISSVRRNQDGTHELSGEQYYKINPTTPSPIDTGLLFDLNGPCAQPLSVVTSVAFNKLIDGSKVALGSVDVSPAMGFQGGQTTQPGCTTALWLTGSHCPVTDALIGDRLRMLTGAASRAAYTNIVSYTVASSGKLVALNPALSAAPSSGDRYMVAYRTPAFMGFELFTQPSTSVLADQWSRFGTYTGQRAEWTDDTTSRSYVFKIVPFTEHGTKNEVGTWVVSMTAIADSTRPQDVQDYSATQVGNVILHTWTPVTDTDLDHYEIREGTDWESGKVVEKVIYRTHFEMSTFLPGERTFFNKAWDRSGNESANAAQSTASLVGPESRRHYVIRDEMEQLTGLFSGMTTLIVGSVTNLLRQSEAIHTASLNSPWQSGSAADGFITATVSRYLDPFRNNNATQLNWTTFGTFSEQSVMVTTGTLVQTSATFAQSKDMTFSLWLKSSRFGKTSYYMRLQDSQFPNSYFAEQRLTIGKEWQRCEVSKAFTGASSGYAQACLSTGGLQLPSVYAWGAQMETGATASRYVKTTVAEASASKLALGLAGTAAWDQGQTWDDATLEWDQGLTVMGDYVTETLDFNQITDLRTQADYRWYDANGTVRFGEYTAVDSAHRTSDGLRLLGSGEDLARYRTYDITLTAADTGDNPRIDRLLFVLDAETHAVRETVTVPSCAGLNVAFFPRFSETPDVVVTPQNLARFAVVTSLSNFSAQIQLFDSAAPSSSAGGQASYVAIGI